MASISFEFYSASVQRIVHTNIFLPCDAMAAMTNPTLQPPYRTLYMLTGFGDNANRLAQEANLSKFSDQYGIAIVVLEGSNLFYVDSNPMTRYSTLVGEELIEITRKAFRLSDKREDTFIGGMSMGGFGAFFNGLKYSDVFSKIAMDAPAFDIYGVTVPGTELPAFPTQFLDGIFGSKQNYEDTFNYRACIETAKASGKALPKLYLGIGTEDILVGNGVKGFKAYAEANEIEVDYHEVPGSHDFVFMANILDSTFAFLAK